MATMDMHGYLNTQLVLLQQQLRGWGVSGLPAGLWTWQKLAEHVETRVTWWCSESQPQLFCLATWEGAEAEPSSGKG